jgi:hypothetical protein
MKFVTKPNLKSIFHSYQIDITPRRLRKDIKQRMEKMKNVYRYDSYSLIVNLAYCNI